MLEIRDELFSQPPPPPRTRDSNNPTLLFSWWCTLFSAAIIITRLCGRKTRSNVLFREDWIMMLALVPLFIRMAFIHVVLLYGTNNVQTAGEHLSATDIAQRMIGSRLVLAARIFYALFIWTCKLTISEFLKRITIRIWRRSYELTLRGIRIFLVLTFCIVVIATLSECQPFDHYWQVIPDPGPHCRQGYANLIAMGTSDSITDILLIAFPIPIIVRSGQTWKRKFQLSALFSLSCIMIAITATRVPLVIEKHGRQQYRTVWASAEILAATAVSNMVIIGSFLRDKGTKRHKYRAASVSDSIDRSSARRPTITAIQNTGSEEDLFRFLGIRVPEHLQEPVEDAPRPAPPATSATPAEKSSQRISRSSNEAPRESGENHSSDSGDSLSKQHHLREPIVPSPAPSSRRAASFFDVGGLLEDGLDSSEHRVRAQEGTLTHDFAPATPSQSRRGSRAFLQDVGGLLTPASSRPSSDRFPARRQSDPHIAPPSRHVRAAPTGVLGPMLERRETQQSLQDAGGLLTDIPEKTAPAPANRRAFSDAALLVVDHVIPRSAQQRIRGRGGHDAAAAAAEEEEEEGFEFQDLGGLLSPSHQLDPSAAALERVIEQQASRKPSADVLESAAAAAAAPPRSMPAPSRSAGWESMSFDDPGGLLRA